MSAPSLLAPASAGPACCEDETWRRVPDWPHEASTCGRVRSINRRDGNGVWRLGAILPQYPDKRKGKGYLYANLLDGKRFRRAAVAVVVLEAHRGLRPFPDWEACHGNGIRTGNHLANLRWDTREANLADQRRHAQERAMGGAVTGNYAKRDRNGVNPSQEARSPRSGRPRAPVTASVTGDAFKGTVGFSFLFSFSSLFTSVKPSLRALRALRSPRKAA